MDLGEAIPWTFFSTEGLAGGDSFDAWQEVLSPMFDLSPAAQPRPTPFAASVKAHHLGALVAGEHRSGPVRFARDARSLTNGIDHYLLQLYLSGGFLCAAGEELVNVEAGDVCLLDLGQPLDGHAVASNAISVVIPRDQLETKLPTTGDLHGLVLKGSATMGGLLGEYLRALAMRLDRLTVDEAPLVARSTVDIAAACFQPTADTVARARPALAAAATSRIKRYIAHNLHAASLSPEQICATFRLSRSYLYRLFEASGGVSRYILTRRLHAAFHNLTDPLQRRKGIAQIAYELGFASEAHFSRSFRALFGFTPSHAREKGEQARVALGEQTASKFDSPLRTWVEGLRR